MKKSQKNRIYMLIFYSLLGLMAYFSHNMIIVMGIFTLIWFSRLLFINHRFYKMDELEVQIMYRSVYYTYLVLIFVLIIGAIGYRANWPILQNISMEIVLEILIVGSLFLETIFAFIIQRVSKI